MRTFSRDQWEASLAAWEAGEFSDEWKPYRHAAAMRGFPYPPSGSKWDAWDDDSPSQRAMLIRAIRETPALLSRCIARSRSWSEVIAQLTGARDSWRADVGLIEEQDRHEHELAQPGHREAVMSLGAILGRLDVSR